MVGGVGANEAHGGGGGLALTRRTAGGGGGLALMRRTGGGGALSRRTGVGANEARAEPNLCLVYRGVQFQPNTHRN